MCATQEHQARAGCEWDVRLPVEGVSGEGLEAGSVGGGGEDGEQASGRQELDGGWDGGLHVVDGAEGDAVVAGFQFFGAGAVDLGSNFWGLDAEGANGFAEEGCFLVLGFGEGDGDFGAED